MADGRATHERPSQRRGAARTAVVWSAIEPVLATSAGQVVVDVGGGTGGLATRIAELGHRVTVVDPSPDALAALGRRARESEVEIAAVQGDLHSVADLIAPGSADLVLCHGVLELAAEPVPAVATLAGLLGPGGHLSLVVAQRHAAVIARAMAGHFGQARELLDATGTQGRAGRRFTAEELVDVIDAAGLSLESIHGVRVFSDVVPGALLDLEPGAAAALIELEAAVAQRAEFWPLAAQLHALAAPAS